MTKEQKRSALESRLAEILLEENLTTMLVDFGATLYGGMGYCAAIQDRTRPGQVTTTFHWFGHAYRFEDVDKYLTEAEERLSIPPAAAE